MSKKKNGQKKLINELKNQLLIQAERLGVKEKYTPIVMAEMKIDAVRRILGEFYSERANLEYELNMLGSKKKEILIKLERLNSYVRKAESLGRRHNEAIEKLVEKGMGDRKSARKAVSRINPVRISAAV